MNDDIFFPIFVSSLVLLTLFLLGFAIKEHSEFEAACKSRGGVAMFAYKSNPICVDPKVFK